MRQWIIGTVLAGLAPVALAASTPSPNLSDEQFLAADSTFQNRVEQSLLATCSAIANEAVAQTTISLHLKRANFCASIMQPSMLPTWKVVFAAMVATDANVIGDATASGATPLSGTNAQTQASLVTDAHIGNAISSQFNTLLVMP